MLSAEKVLKLLANKLQINPRDCGVPNEVQLEEGKLLNKIRMRLGNAKQKNPHAVNFEHFRYFGDFEVGKYNGCQLLHLFVSLVNDPKILQNGNCVVFSIRGEYRFALLVFKPNWIDIITMPAEDSNHRYFYKKLFDDYSVNDEKYDIEQVQQLRSILPEKLQDFMKQPLADKVSCRYTAAFLGVLINIARRYCDDEHVQSEDRLLNRGFIPVCLKLAVDSAQSGKLEEVMLYRHLNFDDVKEDFVSNFRKKHGKQPCSEEIELNFRTKRAESETAVAIEILTHFKMPDDGEGLYNEISVEEMKSKLKTFYEI
ncbi:uncharacterized protein LOC143452504 [Clavelina lepadiformis]|uniref:uncharacterized protein LOC143452504 n=1 Tax=Clavelina lepadiformis TaxID=159417 RepID=UPI0040437180